MPQKTPMTAFIGLALSALLLVGAGCAKDAEPMPAPGPAAGAPEAAAPTSAMPANDAAVPEAVVNAAQEPEGAMMKETPTADETKVFKITAKNFEFAPSEIRVKTGDKVRFEVTSADTGAGEGHGIAIPAFSVNVKMDVGQTAVADFVADKAGSYPFFCNVFCGQGHREMKGTLIVE